MVAARADNNKLIARDCAVFQAPWQGAICKAIFNASSTYFCSNSRRQRWQKLSLLHLIPLLLTCAPIASHSLPHPLFLLFYV